MMLTSHIFEDIVRPCNNCGVAFDVRLYAPHILPCSHTFCLMCLSKTDQRKKRHCFQCKTKYSKYCPNVALMEVIQRIEERRQWLDKEARKCDECDNCVPVKLMRRCETCENHFSSRTDVSLECVVCLECCVNSHNDHKLGHVRCRSPSISEPPIVKFRPRKESTSSVMSFHIREQKNRSSQVSSNSFLDSLKRLSLRRSSKHFSFIMAPSSPLSYNEEDIVMQCNTPFFENSQSKTMRASSSRFICNDTTSVDSVFEGSPQSTVMHQSSNNPNHSPISLRLFCPPNDSGIHSSTPLSRFARSSISLHPNITSSTPKYPKTAHFGTIRPRVRMGVSDLINNRQSSSFSPISKAPSLKSTRSESSVCQIAENPQYGFV